METDEIVSGFILELRRGTIMLCVLSQLKEPTYGYNLISKLSAGGVPVEANTLYPLLRRLEGQGLIQSTWNTESAKPRKYYCVTDIGKQVLDLLKKHWQSTVKSVNVFLEGSNYEK